MNTSSCPLPIVLSLLIHAGGGRITESHQSGLGTCLRLEDNALLRRPLPLAEAIGRDAVTRLYPAAIVDPGPALPGLLLVPLTSARLCRIFDPELYELCRVGLVATRMQPAVVEMAPHGLEVIL